MQIQSRRVVYSNNAGVIAFRSLSSQKNCYTRQILLLWMKTVWCCLKMSPVEHKVLVYCVFLYLFISSVGISELANRPNRRACVCVWHCIPPYLLHSKTLLIIAFWLHYGATSKRANWICLSDAQQCGKIPFRKKIRLSRAIFWLGSGSQHESFDMAGEGKKKKLLHLY